MATRRQTAARLSGCARPRAPVAAHPCPLRAAGEYRTVEVESLKIDDRFRLGRANHAGLPARPLRHHEPRRGARHRDRRPGHAVLPSRRGAMQGGAIDVRQAVRLARGDRVRLTIPVPIFADSENIRFEIRGGRPRRSNASTTPGSRAAACRGDASALIVADPRDAVWNDRPQPGSDGRVGFRAVQDGHRRSDGQLRHDASRGPVQPRRRRSTSCSIRRACPTNWLGYTSLRAVVDRTGGVGAAERRAEERAAHVDRVRRRSDLRRRRPRATLLPGERRSLRQAPRIARSAPTSSVEFTAPTSASMHDGRPGRASCLAAEKVQDANWALPANGARDWGVDRSARLPAADSRHRRRAGPRVSARS